MQIYAPMYACTQMYALCVSVYIHPRVYRSVYVYTQIYTEMYVCTQMYALCVSVYIPPRVYPRQNYSRPPLPARGTDTQMESERASERVCACILHFCICPFTLCIRCRSRLPDVLATGMLEPPGVRKQNRSSRTAHGEAPPLSFRGGCFRGAVCVSPRESQITNRFLAPSPLPAGQTDLAASARAGARAP